MTDRTLHWANILKNRSGNTKGNTFHAASVLACPDCNETVRVGFGGTKNLAIHCTSKACKRKQGMKDKGPKRAPERPSQGHHNLCTFFKPCVPLNPLTVVAPASIHTDDMSFSGLSETCSNNVDLKLDLETLETRKQVTKEAYPETKEMAEEIQVEMGAPLGTLPLVAGTLKTKNLCPKGVDLLNKLEAATTHIPNNIPLATLAHQLSIFLVNPCSWVASLEDDPEVDLEDNWMVLNSMLKTVFGWGELDAQENVKGMLNRSKHGLDRFIQFFKYFILQQGLEGALIEPKIEGLLHEIEKQ